jgi:hypothetical protein
VKLWKRIGLKLPKGSGPRRWAFMGTAALTSTLMAFDCALWRYTLALTVLLGLVWIIRGDK